MEREHRHFDGKSQEERQEQPDRIVEFNFRSRGVKLRNSKRVSAGHGVMVEVKEQNSQQHQHGTEQRIEEELDRRIEFSRPAPDADKQIHRHQHRFPEHKKEEEIQRHEDAQHAGLQHQEPNVIFFYPSFDRAPRRKNRNPSQQRSEHDQQKRNAINAQVETRPNRRNPVVRSPL